MLGESNPFGGKDDDTAPTPNADAGIKVEASMCHLRGILMLKLNRGVQAKQCFMEALALDVKCYESFEQLMSGEMMTPDEGALYTVSTDILLTPLRMALYKLPPLLLPPPLLSLAPLPRRPLYPTNIHLPSTQILARD